MSSVCIRLGFSPKQLIILHQIIIIEPDFLCLADEIVEPRQDMTIKVTAFTESKKFYYTAVEFSSYSAAES